MSGTADGSDLTHAELLDIAEVMWREIEHEWPGLPSKNLPQTEAQAVAFRKLEAYLDSRQ